MEIQKIYNKEFYAEHQDESLSSARVIVPIILDVFPATSVVDVGCGVGAWLSVFLREGVTDIKGFDGGNLPKASYMVDKEKIVSGCDLSSSAFMPDITADVAVCLEVAEHLPEKKSDTLIRNLTELSSVVIFSAAMPGQQGVNHINEQPPWYWREKFLTEGYEEIDFLRPAIWCDSRVAWWYRQNITSYVNRDILRHNESVRKIYKQYQVEPGPGRLTLISERILDKLLHPPRSKKSLLQKFKNRFTGTH